MKFSVETHINIPRNLAKVENKQYWLFAANEYHKLLSPYVPMQTGALDETVRIKSYALNGEIEYIAPYAHYIYEGRLMVDPDTGSSYAQAGAKKVYTGANLDLSHNKHPLSSAHWDKAAEPTQKPKLIDAMQDYADSGRLNLND